MKRLPLYIFLAAAIILAGCKDNNLPVIPEDPVDPDGPEVPIGPEEPPVPENPYGDAELEKITATTTWEGAIFDAIISANTTETEWTSPDGENFINAKLGYLAGQTTSTDESGNPKVTYG